MALQEERRRADPDTAAKIDGFCLKLQACTRAEMSFTVEVDDSTGNSFVESSSTNVDSDALLNVSFYNRTAEQNAQLGLVVQGELTFTESKLFKARSRRVGPDASRAGGKRLRSQSLRHI